MNRILGIQSGGQAARPPVIVYVSLILVIIHIVYYIFTGPIETLLAASLFSYLISRFNKNIVIILLAGLFAAYIFTFFSKDIKKSLL